MNYLDYQQAEVEWYSRNGEHHSRRIATDRAGNSYVVGDWSWNQRLSNPREVIENRMGRSLQNPAPAGRTPQ